MLYAAFDGALQELAAAMSLSIMPEHTVIVGLRHAATTGAGLRAISLLSATYRCQECKDSFYTFSARDWPQAALDGR